MRVNAELSLKNSNTLNHVCRLFRLREIGDKSLCLLFLGPLASALAGMINVFLATHYSLGVELGWSLLPGKLLVQVVGVLGVISYVRTRRALASVGLAIIFSLPLFLEYAHLNRPAWCGFGVFLTVIATTRAAVVLKNNWVVFAAWALTAGYMQSVFMYDLFEPGQMMNFFVGGWTT